MFNADQIREAAGMDVKAIAEQGQPTNMRRLLREEVESAGGLFVDSVDLAWQGHIAGNILAWRATRAAFKLAGVPFIASRIAQSYAAQRLAPSAQPANPSSSAGDVKIPGGPLYKGSLAMYTPIDADTEAILKERKEARAKLAASKKEGATAEEIDIPPRKKFIVIAPPALAEAERAGVLARINDWVYTWGLIAPEGGNPNEPTRYDFSHRWSSAITSVLGQPIAVGARGEWPNRMISPDYMTDATALQLSVAVHNPGSIRRDARKRGQNTLSADRHNMFIRVGHVLFMTMIPETLGPLVQAGANRLESNTIRYVQSPRGLNRGPSGNTALTAPLPGQADLMATFFNQVLNNVKAHAKNNPDLNDTAWTAACKEILRQSPQEGEQAALDEASIHHFYEPHRDHVISMLADYKSRIKSDQRHYRAQLAQMQQTVAAYDYFDHVKWEPNPLSVKAQCEQAIKEGLVEQVWTTADALLARLPAPQIRLGKNFRQDGTTYKAGLYQMQVPYIELSYINTVAGRRPQQGNIRVCTETGASYPHPHVLGGSGGYPCWAETENDRMVHHYELERTLCSDLVGFFRFMRDFLSAYWDANGRYRPVYHYAERIGD